MGRKKTNLFGVPIDCISIGETIDLIEQAIKKNDHIRHVVVNAGKLVAMSTDKDLYQSVLDSDIINADGQAVVWAGRLLGSPLKERVAGIDLMEKLVDHAFERKYKLFFLGADEATLNKLIRRYSDKYSSEIIGGYRNGYFSENEEENVVKDIVKSASHILFVGISSPKKETFLFRNKERLRSVNLIMGVGGSFDVIAGKTKRAPLWMRNVGFEWFFRFIQEPKRLWKRYLVGNSLFILLVFKELFKRKK